MTTGEGMDKYDDVHEFIATVALLHSLVDCPTTQIGFCQNSNFFRFSSLIRFQEL
jgi:hypothetical protein